MSIKMIDFLSQPWAWYISGPLIAFVMLILLWLGGNFGVSSTFRTLCSIGGAGKGNQAPFFKYDWKSQIWNLIFIMGSLIGGVLASTFLTNPAPLDISPNTISDLAKLNIDFDGSLVPQSLFNWNMLFEFKGFLIMIMGGWLVGFGTQWAGGCTSGHAISGLSNLQLASLIAVIGFFIGGLIMTFFVFPLIF